MDILQPVYTEKTECQDCYKCVRECPSKAILVENNHAAIIHELCVSCGHCVLVCPSKAKRVRDDLGRAKQLISLGEKVVVSLAPSFKSEFHDTKPEQLISAIKKRLPASYGRAFSEIHWANCCRNKPAPPLAGWRMTAAARPFSSSMRADLRPMAPMRISGRHRPKSSCVYVRPAASSASVGVRLLKGESLWG